MLKSLEDWYIPEPNTGCWLFTGRTHAGITKQYGKVTRRGKTWLVHRLFYTELRGEIAEGLTIDHLCRVPSCVNPWHMEAVPIRVNILRGRNRAAQHARMKTCPKGHAFSVVIWGRRQRRNCTECKADRQRIAQRAERIARGA